MYGASDKEAEITIPTTELSVDMLRRCIYQDKNVVKLLGLLDWGNLSIWEIFNLEKLSKKIRERSSSLFHPQKAWLRLDLMQEIQFGCSKNKNKTMLVSVDEWI